MLLLRGDIILWLVRCLVLLLLLVLMLLLVLILGMRLLLLAVVLRLLWWVRRMKLLLLLLLLGMFLAGGHFVLLCFRVFRLSVSRLSFLPSRSSTGFGFVLFPSSSEQ